MLVYVDGLALHLCVGAILEVWVSRFLPALLHMYEAVPELKEQHLSLALLLFLHRHVSV